MRRQLFASAVSVALLLGAASPALAKPGKGQANGHDKPAKTKPAKDPKPPKTKDGRVNGGGITVTGAEFSVQAREGQPSKGHFNYTTASVKVRCKGVTFSRIVQVPPVAAVEVTDTNCLLGSGKRATPVELNASFFDNGASGDRAIIRVTRRDGTEVVNEDGTIKEGNIHVR